MEAANRIWSVNELTRYIKNILGGDAILQNVWVRGEISNFKHHSAGHMYFTVKDESSSLRCVMFRSRNGLLSFVPADGMRVLINGYIGLYEKSGQYQMYAEEMQPDGLGALHLAYEQLKKKLEAEGMFSPERKRPLPYLPRKIGIVTSPTGAAIRDMITVLRRRFPNSEIILAPVHVQGGEAPAEISRALHLLGEVPGLDVVIVGRGGGSLEELQAFNTETVARAIAGCAVPVVSAVGHETDFTLSDLAADVRAPTPSAAAEIVVPEKAELSRLLRSLQVKLIYTVKRRLELERSIFNRCLRSHVFRRPTAQLFERRQEVGDLQQKLTLQIRHRTQLKKQAVAALAGRLNTLNPLGILARGYAVCLNSETGTVIRRIKDAAAVSRVDVRVTDGKLHCRIIEIKEDTGDGEEKAGGDGNAAV